MIPALLIETSYFMNFTSKIFFTLVGGGDDDGTIMTRKKKKDEEKRREAILQSAGEWYAYFDDRRGHTDEASHTSFISSFYQAICKDISDKMRAHGRQA